MEKVGFTLDIIGLRNLFYQKVGRLYKNKGRLWRVSDCEELVGTIAGDEGIGNAFPTVLPNADYSYYTLKTSGFKTF